MDEDTLNLEIIVNNKVSSAFIDNLFSHIQVTDGGQAVIQLETGQLITLPALSLADYPSYRRRNQTL